MMNAYTADPMNQPPPGYEAQQHPYPAYPVDPMPMPAPTSAVSWAAVLAGAVAAAALSLILLILGTGLGMAAVSPWTFEGMGAKALGISSIVWLAVMQLLSAGMGGYLAGRLRTRWLDAARDEVFFRDTAHGFLAWAVATLLTAAVLTSAVSSIVGAGVQAGASVVGNAASGATSSAAAAAGGAMAGRDGPPDAGNEGFINYLVDSLFREPGETRAGSAGSAGAPPSASTSTSPGATSGTAPDTAPDTTPDTAATSPTPTPGSPNLNPSPSTGTASATSNTTPRSTPAPGRSAAQDSAEVARIFMNADLSQPLPPEDQRRVAQIVSQRTGLSQAEAEQRVSQNYAQMQTRLQQAEDRARATADEARKATAASALWLFVSLLFGAFMASLAATFGGRQRDA